MFNIIFKGIGWKEGVDTFDKSRVLESTAAEVKGIYAPGGVLDLDRVRDIPTIFASESDYEDFEQVAKIGRITQIRLSGSMYRIDYVCDGPITRVPQTFLENNKTLLDLTDWDFKRTHWAIKDVDLYKILLSVQLSSPEDIGAQGGVTADQSDKRLLHEKIIESSWTLYSSGHFRQAVLDSMLMVQQMVKDKSGKIDGDGVALIQHVFSIKNPLLFLGAEQSKTGLNEHEGYMYMLQGAMTGIRNPGAHTLSHNLNATSAMQHLVFASMLACRINNSVERADK